MKQILFIICGLIYSLNVLSQKANCDCGKEKIDLEEPISCDTTIFKNKAKLYWQWNCDSIWLTFENRGTLTLKSIRTCEIADINLCPKIGLVFLKEYSYYLLFKDVLYPDFPYDIVYVSKETGDESSRISKNLVIQNDIDKNYLLYFSHASYKKLVYLDYNKTGQFNSIEFDEKKVLNSADKNGIEVNNLFSNFKQSGDYFTFDFKNAEGQIEHLKIDIK